MKYSVLRDYLIAHLPARWEGLEFYPGPNLPANTANRFVLLTRTGGPGLETDGLIDVQGWQFRVASEQNNYDDGEDLAFDLDAIALNSGYSRSVGGVWMVDLYRAGSPPTMLLVDDAERTHFVASYLASVQSALA